MGFLLAVKRDWSIQRFYTNKVVVKIPVSSAACVASEPNKEISTIWFGGLSSFRFLFHSSSYTLWILIISYFYRNKCCLMQRHQNLQNSNTWKIVRLCCLRIHFFVHKIVGFQSQFINYSFIYEWTHEWILTSFIIMFSLTHKWHNTILFVSGRKFHWSQVWHTIIHKLLLWTLISTVCVFPLWFMKYSKCYPRWCHKSALHGF